MATRKYPDLCPVQVACDGADLLHNRKMCGACEDKMRKRELTKKLKELEACRMTYAAKRRRKEIEQALAGDDT